MELFLKILNGMANSVDPDQTAPSGTVWSGSALFAYVILSDTLVFEIFGTFTILILSGAMLWISKKKKKKKKKYLVYT